MNIVFHDFKIRFLVVAALLSLMTSTSILALVQTHEAGDIIQDEFGVEMVYVPGGTFTLGIDKERLRLLCEQRGEDNPDRCVEIIQEDTGATYLRTVEIQPFWIDRFEVTIEQFNEFCGSNANTDIDDCLGTPRDAELALNPNQPQVNVSWYAANFICNQRNARLPTEAEWEFAASGFENSVFAWGDTFNLDYIHLSDSQFTRTYPVGSIPENVSWVGAYDMTGNVEEWVEDRFSVRILSNIEPEDWPSPYIINTLEYSRMTKGGFWNSPFWNLTNFYREQATSTVGHKKGKG
jgi:formylglycine-generating enzyme required for sulfatase activity